MTIFFNSYYKQIDVFRMRKNCQSKEVWNFSFWFSKFQTFLGKFTWVGQVVASEISKIKIYAKFWVFLWKTLFVLVYSCTTLKHIKNYLIKSTYQGINFALFHVHYNTLELSIWHFQTPKDQGYLKLTQKFENFDIAKHQKCPFLNQKKTRCLGLKFLRRLLFMI